jgi:hypothetical protein
VTDTSAVMLYGFELVLPCDHSSHIDRILRETGMAQAGIGYTYAGPLDAEKLYLTAQYHEATISEALAVELDCSVEVRLRWDGLLNKAARSLGAFEHEPARWFLLVREL